MTKLNVKEQRHRMKGKKGKGSTGKRVKRVNKKGQMDEQSYRYLPPDGSTG